MRAATSSPACDVVDAERLARVLRAVTDDLAVLARYRDGDEDRHDQAVLGHIKYLFITLVEGCIDAAHHVAASEGYGPPADNADAIRLLARHGHLSADLADGVADAVRFRDVLVHRYRTVDDDLVLAHLADLELVRRYVSSLAELIERDG